MVVGKAARGPHAFVYAVRSTGIYCRPDCPSRRPAPGQIVFFDSPREAVTNGFRACRRCHPEKGTLYSAQMEVVEKACRILSRTPGERWNLTDLALQAGYSPSHLQRVFTNLLGASPKQYLDAVRSGRFRAQLRQGRSVRSSTYLAGHRSLSWPYSGSGVELGMDAGEYRRGGASQLVGFLTVASPMGPLLVAATARGVSFVGFGEPEGTLLDQLRNEFPRATLRRSSTAPLTLWAARIVGSLEGGRLSLNDLPLDIRATTFQARVWNAVRAIHRGSTRTYGEIAAAAGSPGAARAAARACATNPTAILIPCHRVLREDGGPGGYRWGLDRKRQLLAKEHSRP